MSESFDVMGECIAHRSYVESVLTLTFTPPDCDHVKVSRELLVQLVRGQAEYAGWQIVVTA